VALEERLLDRCERAVIRGEALDGGDVRADRRDREHQARPDGLPVHQHRARAAHPVLTADMRARKSQVVAQRVGQQPTCGYRDVVGSAVDDQAYVVQVLAHRALISASSWAERSTRAVSTRTSCAR
jgi:hypothetical protein